MSRFWYLGSPYKRYPGGIEAAYREVCRIAGFFARNGITVYSPIAHTHPIAIASGLDPLDHAIWLPLHRPIMMAARRGLIIAKMAGWEDSYGLCKEAVFFREVGRPIRYLDPETMTLDGKPLAGAA